MSLPYEHYRADFVISSESKSVVVEVDEFGHKSYNKEKELIRERFLLQRYDSIIRYNPDNSDEDIFQLINKILKEMAK